MTNVVFSYSVMISVSFSFFFVFMLCYVIYFVTIKYLTKIILLLFNFIFFIESTLIPGSSEMFHVPAFIDAQEAKGGFGRRYLTKIAILNLESTFLILYQRAAFCS